MMTAFRLADRSGVNRTIRARPAARPTLRLLLGLIIGATNALGCASAGTLSGPNPFPGSGAESRRVPPGGRTPGNRNPAPVDALVESALSLRGTPYRFGGSTPAAGLDCSGLVAYVMAQQSVAMPRSVAGQFAVGTPVAWDRLLRGDLVFFSTVGPGATHVGIVTDASRAEFVHAPADGASVRVERFDALYWRNRFVGARRVL